MLRLALASLSLAFASGLSAQCGPATSTQIFHSCTANTQALTAASRPSLGGTWMLGIDGAVTPSPIFHIFVISIDSAPCQSTPFGSVLYNVGLSVSVFLVPPTSGLTTYSLNVPNDPAFCNLPLAVQGAIYDLSLPLGILLTDGELGTVGV